MKFKVDLKISMFKISCFLLEIWILANCFTNVDVKYLPSLSGTYSSLHIHNIIALLWIFIILIKGKFIIPKEYYFVMLIFAEITLVWLLNLYKFGISSGYISVIYGLLIMLFIASISDIMDMNLVCKIFETITIIMSACIVLNIILNISDVVNSLLSGWAHPNIHVFFGGGVNLEAVWMTMFGVFVRKKWQYRYLIFTTLLSVIYVTRTGILVNVFLLMIYIFSDEKNNFIKNIFLGILLLVGVLGLVYKTGILDNVLNRFSNIGTETGSKVRLNIWITLLKGVKDKPLGIGFGNTMKFLREEYSLNETLNNAHNIYLQCILENNFVGFILMMVGWIKIGIDQMKCRFKNPCGLFLVLYAFQGLFQTQLKEPFLYIVLALYLCIPIKNDFSRGMMLVGKAKS